MASGRNLYCLLLQVVSLHVVADLWSVGVNHDFTLLRLRLVLVPLFALSVVWSQSSQDFVVLPTMLQQCSWDDVR